MEMKTNSAIQKPKSLPIQFFPYLLMWGLFISMYAPIIRTVVSYWERYDYSHAYFILPTALFLVWHKRGYLRNILSGESSNKNQFLYLASILTGLFMFSFGWRHDFAFVMTSSLIPLLIGMVGYAYGHGILKAVLFPILYLVFLIPLPIGVLDSVTLPMRHGVSVATEHILRFAHYPISREGLLLSIGGHNVYLGEACSGFRSLITLSSLGLAYIFLIRGNKIKKLAMSAAIMPLALAGNLIRVISVVLVTFYIGENQAQRFYHDFSGFVIFAVLIVGLLIIEKQVK